MLDAGRSVGLKYFHNNGSVKETKVLIPSGITIHYPALRGVWVNILTPKTCVSALSRRASQHLKTKVNVQCLSSPPVCTEK